MTAKTDDHLTEDQIYQSLLDPSDLSESGKAHLLACSRCRTALDALSGELQTVGTLALAATPESTGKFRLPDQHPGSPFSILTGMPPFARVVASALALFLVIGVVLLVNPAHKNPILYEAGQILDPDQLLSEIDELVEAPFASEFLFTTSLNDLDADEDFMEYIVPLIDDDPITRISGKKGEYLC